MRVIETASEWRVKSPATGWIAIPKGRGWTFNGDFERPTFTPSVNETWGTDGETREHFERFGPTHRNHVFIRDGQIEYLADCTHSLAGHTVDIPPLSEAEIRRYRRGDEQSEDA